MRNMNNCIANYWYYFYFTMGEVEVIRVAQK